MGLIGRVGIVVIFKKETGKRSVLLGLFVGDGIGDLTKLKVIGTIQGDGITHKEN